jgi:hypothetical protein
MLLEVLVPAGAIVEVVRVRLVLVAIKVGGVHVVLDLGSGRVRVVRVALG